MLHQGQVSELYVGGQMKTIRLAFVAAILLTFVAYISSETVVCPLPPNTVCVVCVRMAHRGSEPRDSQIQHCASQVRGVVRAFAGLHNSCCDWSS